MKLTIGLSLAVSRHVENDKRKQSFYFPVEMLDEVAVVARRLDRSLSWVIQQAWRQARREIMRFPAATQPEADRDDAVVQPQAQHK
jgi:uncharacterized small protein (TIGR04563 family)